MTQPSTHFQETIQRGLALNRDGYFREAIGVFRAALARSPHDPVVFAGLGDACLGLRLYDRALECYKLAARHSRGDINNMNRVADVQERLGQLTEASRTYLASGELFLHHGRLEEAIDNWERSVRLDPGMLAAHQRLAMVFQRQGNVRAAVREYLAIARVLQGRGETNNVLRMCQAALRLDPGNADILTAIELVRHGDIPPPTPRPTPPEPPPPVSAPEESLADAVRQLTNIFEAERAAEPALPPDADPVETALELAKNQLAEEIFREEDEKDRARLSKLERDALIGQGMDFEMRGRLDAAVACYEKAIRGGLTLPAAYFTLGMLYARSGRREAAIQSLRLAGRHPTYQRAAAIALGRIA